MNSAKTPQGASNIPAALLVYDKSPRAVAELFAPSGPPHSRELLAIAEAWLREERTPYLIVATTGGSDAKTITMGVYNEEDLLANALPEAMSLMLPEAIAESICAAVDRHLDAKVSERWEILKSFGVTAR